MSNLNQIILTGVTLALASCNQKKEPVTLTNPIVETELSTKNLSSLLVDQRALSAITQFPRTISTIQEISDAQARNFSETGSWTTQEKLNVYENQLWEAVSLDLLKKPLSGKPNEEHVQILMNLHQAGFHIYLGLMNVEGKSYFNISLYQLGAVKNSPELEKLKKVIGMSDREEIGMRELIEAFSTANSVALYGSPGTDKNILVNITAILNDYDIPQREMSSVFNAVIINELAHLKITQAIATGKQKPCTRQQQEAFSDYWTILVAPASEILFDTRAILINNTERYQQSKELTVKGIESFCKSLIPKFTNLSYNLEDFDRLILIPENLPKLKVHLLNAYKTGLINSGLNPELF